MQAESSKLPSPGVSGAGQESGRTLVQTSAQADGSAGDVAARSFQQLIDQLGSQQATAPRLALPGTGPVVAGTIGPETNQEAAGTGAQPAAVRNGGKSGQAASSASGRGIRGRATSTADASTAGTAITVASAAPSLAPEPFPATSTSAGAAVQAEARPGTSAGQGEGHVSIHGQGQTGATGLDIVSSGGQPGTMVLRDDPTLGSGAPQAGKSFADAIQAGATAATLAGSMAEAAGQAATPSAGSASTNEAAAAGMGAILLPAMMTVAPSQPSVSGAAAASSPAVGGTGAASVAAQVAPSLAALVAKGGSQSVTVALHPADLGTVHIRIEQPASGPAHVTLAAERPETLEALRQGSAQLDAALDRAGLPAHARSVSFETIAPAEPSAVAAASAGQGAIGNGGASGEPGSGSQLGAQMGGHMGGHMGGQMGGGQQQPSDGGEARQGGSGAAVFASAAGGSDDLPMGASMRVRFGVDITA